MTSAHHMSPNKSKGGMQSQIEHKSLKLFDLHKKTKSKIPILVDKEIVEKMKMSNGSIKSKSNNLRHSKIPVYKTDLTYSDSAYIRSSVPSRFDQERQHSSTLKKRSHVPPELHRSEYMSIKTRKTVKLHGLELTSIPEDIFYRKDLESLILSPERESCIHFKLPFLPSAIGQLTKLRTLVLDTNELQEIPNEIENLQELETLILGNNCLTHLPVGLEKLKKLKSLHLANNRFEKMPTIICSLPSLRFLDLSNNSLQYLPSEICQLSETLNTLLLIMNKIVALPATFALLTSLTCLWLGENNLRGLPDNFGNLCNLDWGEIFCSSNIDGNPLERPPLEVCRQGPQEIEKYFHQLKHPNKKLSPTYIKKKIIPRKRQPTKTQEK